MPQVIATPLIGVDVGSTGTEQKFGLGTVVAGTDGKSYMYVKSHAAISAAGVVTVNGSFNTAAGTGYTAPVAFAAANVYGWVYKTTSPF